MANEHECSNCGEGCSEEDIAGGLCARCDEAAAEDLRRSAEEQPAMECSYDERPFDGDRDFADLDGVRW